MAILDLDTLSDEDLVDHIRTTDQEVFRVLIKRYQSKLLRYTASYVHDEEKAMDIVQETFIKAYVNLNSFDAGRRFSPWLYRIAHNQVMNSVRKYKQEVPADEDWLDKLPDEERDLVADLDRKLKREEVRRAVALLPMKYQDVVVLYYFEGHEYEYIAKVLSIPASTVGTRIRRAKSKLQAKLQDIEATS